MNFETLKSLPEFLSPNDLVNLGLYSTSKAVYFSRTRGSGPDFVQMGRRVVYPKESVIEFITSNMVKRKKSLLDREKSE